MLSQGDKQCRMCLDLFCALKVKNTAVLSTVSFSIKKSFLLSVILNLLNA